MMVQHNLCAERSMPWSVAACRQALLPPPPTASLAAATKDSNLTSEIRAIGRLNRLYMRMFFDAGFRELESLLYFSHDIFFNLNATERHALCSSNVT